MHSVHATADRLWRSYVGFVWGGAMVYEENSNGLDKMHMDVVLSNKHEMWGGRGDY